MREGACTVIAGKSKNDFSLTILQQKTSNTETQSIYDDCCRLPRLLTQQGLTTIERVDDAG